MITFLQLLVQQLYWEINRQRNSGTESKRANAIWPNASQSQSLLTPDKCCEIENWKLYKICFVIITVWSAKKCCFAIRKPHFMIVNVRILCIHTYRPINTWCFYGNVIVYFASWGAICALLNFVIFLWQIKWEFQLIHLMTQNVESIG